MNKIKRTPFFLLCIMTCIFPCHATSFTDKSLKEKLSINTENINEYTSSYFSHTARKVRTNLTYFESEHDNNDNNTTSLHERVQDTCEKLTTVGHWEENFPKLCGPSHQNLMPAFKKRINQLVFNLGEEMDELARLRNPALRSKVMLVRALRPLDPWTKNNQAFSSLYQKFKKALYSDVIDAQKLFNYIENKNYSHLFNELIKLQEMIDHNDKHSKDVKEKVLDHFHYELQGYIRKVDLTIMNLNSDDVDFEKIGKLESDISKIQNAQKYFFREDSLDKKGIFPVEQRKELLKKCGQLTNHLREWCIEYVKNIRFYINCGSFADAEAKIKHLKKLMNILGESYFVDEENNKHEDNEILEKKPKKQDLNAKLGNLKKSIEKALKKREDIYTQINPLNTDFPYNPYIKHPPKDFYQKIRQLIEKNSLYRNAWERVSDDISGKFRKLLEKITQSSNKKTKKKYQMICTYILQSLPNKLHERLEQELKQCKEQADSIQKEEEKELNNVIESGDLELQKKMFVRSLKDDNLEAQDKIKEIIKKRVDTNISTIETNFKEGEIEQVAEHMHDLHKIHKTFNDKEKKRIQKVSLEVTKLKKLIANKCAQHCKNIKAHSKSLEEDNERLIENTAHDLNRLYSFARLYHDSQYTTIQTFFPSSFLSDVEEVITCLHRFFSQKCLDLTKACEEMDRHLLQKVIEGFLHIKPTPFIQNYHNLLNLFEHNTTWVQTLKNYKKIGDDALKYIQEQIEEVKKEGIDNEKTRTNKHERERYCNTLHQRLTLILCIEDTLEKLPESKKNITFPLYKPLQDDLQKQFTKICEDARDILDEASKEGWTKENYLQIDFAYELLGSLKELNYVFFGNKTVQEHKKKLKKGFENYITAIKKRFMQAEPKEVVSLLIELKKVATHVLSLQKSIHDTTQSLLYKYDKAYKEKHGGIGCLEQLTINLQNDPEGIGTAILSQFPIFKGFTISIFNKTTKARGIDTVLQEIKGDGLDTKKLKKRYEAYYNKYEKIRNQYLKCGAKQDLSGLVSTLKVEAAKVSLEKKKKKVWSSTQKDKVPELLAHIFAIWTLQNAAYYYDAVQNNVQEDLRNTFLVTPHPAQVIAIFRILGIESSEKETHIEKHLAEIGTGEGKSVTLAALSSLLVLLGFDVSCACYSEYLSRRDYENFQPLFDEIGVTSHIHYGTFNEIAEKKINKGGNLRQMVSDLLLQGIYPAQSTINKSERPHILLIDEVDVFFDKSFYGNVYPPVASLQHPHIAALLTLIWTKKETITFTQVIKSKEYEDLLQEVSPLKKWKNILQEAIKDMIEDVKAYKNHTGYIIENDKIMYRDQHGYSHKINYGYKTVFAYFKESENNKITPTALQNNLAIYIKLGCFSYAEVPHTFASILGVTGTLSVLSEVEKKIIKDVYHIKKETYVPSLYSKNQCKFAKNADIRIEKNQEDYLTVIAKEIEKVLVNNRCVLVFFETPQMLETMYNSVNFQKIKDNHNYTVQKMTENLSIEEKERAIQRATMLGGVTLASRSFGRGTDFKCMNRIVNRNGGPHVLETSLPEKRSEEAQIKGRTARQGGEGSFSMVLQESSLEKFGITSNDIQKMRDDKEYYKILAEKRDKKFVENYKDVQERVQKIQELHKAAMKFVNTMVAYRGETKKQKDINQHLFLNNKGVEQEQRVRTMVLMDATGSMGSLLTKVKGRVRTMFSRIKKILEEEKFPPSCFAIQLVAYRNYNAPETDILVCSTWESKPDNLEIFMQSIQPKYGQGNEAIELALHHVNKEHEEKEVSQVLLIGDAPPNTPDEVLRKRKNSAPAGQPSDLSITQNLVSYLSKYVGENYWKNTKEFKKPTDWIKETDQLKKNNIPVHTFYLTNSAKEKFTEIATKTSGTHKKLDINQKNGADLLTAVVSKQVLKQIGGKEKGKKMSDLYDKMYTC